MVDAKPFDFFIDVVLDTNVHFPYRFVFGCNRNIVYVGIFVFCGK